MALAVDSTQGGADAGAGATTGGTPLTYSFTNTAGTLIVVAVALGQNSSAAISSVTYGGDALTLIDTQVKGDGNALAALYYRLNPKTGANNVIVNITSEGGNLGIESGAISFTGHDTLNPIRATTFKNTNDGPTTTASVVATGTTTGNILVDVLATGDGYSSTTQTLVWSKNLNTNSGGGCAASSRANGNGGSVTMQYTIVSSDWMMVVAEVQAAAGGGGDLSVNSIGEPVIGGSTF